MRWRRRRLLVYAAVRQGERGGALRVGWGLGSGGGEWGVWAGQGVPELSGQRHKGVGLDSAFLRLHLPDACICPPGRFLPLSPRRSEPWRCGRFPFFSSSESRPLCGSRISPRFAVLFLLSSSDEVEAIIVCSGGMHSPSTSWEMQECKRIVVFRVFFCGPVGSGSVPGFSAAQLLRQPYWDDDLTILCELSQEAGVRRQDDRPGSFGVIGRM